MTSIKQWNKTLKEFHDVINEALHLIISKIVMDYKTEEEQRSLIAEAKINAVRTFVVGLKSEMMRHILYSRTPGSLAEAFTIAQTVYYDHLHTEINNVRPNQMGSSRNQTRPKAKTYVPTTYNSNKPKKPSPETQNNNTNNKDNYRPPNQPYKNQKINQLQENEQSEIEHNDELRNIPDDLISNSSHASSETGTSSVFLDE